MEFLQWQRKQEDIDRITKLQLDILTTCSNYLKKDGELVYSTCSILKEENQNIIEKFLAKNKNFKLFNDSNPYININTNEIQDGFFICKLTKINT